VGQFIKIGEKRKEEVSTFSPQDAFDDHKKMLDYLKVMLEDKHSTKFVVVGHHAPSKLSTHPRYKNEEIMNGGYSSDLSAFILDNPQIKLWTHGHTHEDFDYMIGSTRIVCNPRGYDKYEDRADNFTLKYVDV
jgi:Icc-related predicted phosphoesterase